MRIAVLSRSPFRYRGTRSGSTRRLWIKIKLHALRFTSLGTTTTAVRGANGVAAAVFGFFSYFFGFFRTLILWLYGWLRPGLRRLYYSLLALVRTTAALAVAAKEALVTFHRDAASRAHGRTAALLAMASATVILFSFCYFGLGVEVRLDGKVIGYVDSKSQMEDMISSVEAKATEYFGTPYHYGGNLTYSMSYMKYTNTLSSEEIEDLLFSSIGDVQKTYALSVDGTIIATNDSRTALQMMLRRILKSSSTAFPNAKTEFVQDVQIISSGLDDSHKMSISDLEALLSSNSQETVTYTIQKGDTVSGIASRNGMKISELKNLNADQDLSKIFPGDVVKVSAAVPYLSLKQTVNQSYTESIAYGTDTEYSSSLYTGQSKIKKAGTNGTAAVTADVVYINGVEQSRTVLSYQVVTQPVNEVKLVGTAARPKTAASGHFIKPSSGRFSSGYGYRKSFGDFHTGVDFAGPKGSAIWAADGGTVIWAGWKGNYGYCVMISHGNGYVTLYGHCSKLLVRVGDKVYQGQQIAKVGSTGRSTGPHVHFEIIYNGNTQNPLRYVSK